MTTTDSINQNNSKRYIVKIIDYGERGLSQQWKVLTIKELTKDLDSRDVLEVYELGKQCTLEVTIR